mmetsp:Transcript_12711/g.19074  ORF Transcript_12711/g.19074 Transcript_12711/m.19074 type:complete len:578 (+) Transcript_12711:71-1804(+)
MAAAEQEPKSTKEEKIEDELAALRRLDALESSIEEMLAEREARELIKKVERVGQYGSVKGTLRFYLEHSKEVSGENIEKVSSPRQSRSTDLIWGLHLEARLISASEESIDITGYSMSDFVEKIEVFWDRTKSGSKKEYGAALTWIPPPSPTSSGQTPKANTTSKNGLSQTGNKIVDGLSITRLIASRSSSKSIQARFAIYQKFTTPQYKLSNAFLAKILPKNADCISREALILAIANYIDDNHLRDGRDGRFVYCDELLASALEGIQNFQFQHLESIVNNFLLPPDPIVIDYTIPGGDSSVARSETNTKFFDITVDIFIHNQPYAQLPKPYSELYSNKTNNCATVEHLCFQKLHAFGGEFTSFLLFPHAAFFQDDHSDKNQRNKKRSFLQAFSTHNAVDALRKTLSKHIDTDQFDKLSGIYEASSLPTPNFNLSQPRPFPLQQSGRPPPPGTQQPPVDVATNNTQPRQPVLPQNQSLLPQQYVPQSSLYPAQINAQSPPQSNIASAPNQQPPVEQQNQANTVPLPKEEQRPVQVVAQQTSAHFSNAATATQQLKPTALPPPIVMNQPPKQEQIPPAS